MSLPIPDLDDLDYTKLREELVRDVARAKTPWTDHNIHDPGITILEMLAWQSELLLYRFNRITDRHRLKFLKLLGTTPAPAQPSMVLLSAFHRLSNWIFSLDMGYGQYLQTGEVDNAVKDAFEARGHALPDESVLHNEGEFWMVLDDEGNKMYRIENTGLELKIYKYSGDWPKRLPYGTEVEALLPEKVRMGFTTTESIWLVPHKLEQVMAQQPAGLSEFTQANETAGLFFHPFGPEGKSSFRLLLGFSKEINANEYLFSLDISYRQFLEENQVDDTLRVAFGDNGHPLSPEAEMSVVDGLWEILNDDRRYVVEDTGLELEIYVYKSIPLRLWYIPYKADKSPPPKHTEESTRPLCPAVPSFPGPAPPVEPPVSLVWEYSTGTGEPDWKELRSDLSVQASWDGNEDLDKTVGTVSDDTLALTREGALRLHLGRDAKPCRVSVGTFETKELYWLRCSIRSGRYENPPRADILVPHVVSAIQYRTMSEEKTLVRVKDGTFFPRTKGTGLPCQQFEMECGPIFSLRLFVNEKQTDEIPDWTEVFDFDASGPEDNHYTLDREKGLVTFGDGIRGRVPPPNSEVIARTYRWGGGIQGNVEADVEWVVPKPPDGVDVDHLGLSNPLPATGGTSQEEIDDAFLRILKDLEAPCRAITLADYRELAVKTPGQRVARVEAWSSADGTGVEVVVVPHSTLERPVPGVAFLKAVRCHLDRLRLVTTRLRVSGPDYVPVKVTATARALEGFDPVNLRRQLENTIRGFLDPLEGGPCGEGWPFGKAVYISELHEACSHVEGVECIEKLRISSPRKEVDPADGSLKIEPHQLVYAAKSEVVVKSSGAWCRR